MSKPFKYPGKPKLIHLPEPIAQLISQAAAVRGISAKKYMEQVLEQHICPSYYTNKKEYNGKSAKKQ